MCYYHGRFDSDNGEWYYTDIPEKNGKGSYLKLKPYEEYEL